MAISIAENRDCMEAMKKFPDKYFDLLIADPPYGDASQCQEENEYNRFGGRFERYKSVARTGGTWSEKYTNKIVSWDHAPDDDCFKEMFRVSKNQIIWGGNYFSLPPTRCFLIWDKKQPEDFTMEMCEYAWCSFGGNAKIFRMQPSGQVDRFHPTQKPVDLYEWILTKYAKKGMKILDPFLGSGSSRIAAYNGGYDFWGYEIDEEYFPKEEERFARHTSQLRIEF